MDEKANIERAEEAVQRLSGSVGETVSEPAAELRGPEVPIAVGQTAPAAKGGQDASEEEAAMPEFDVSERVADALEPAVPAVPIDADASAASPAETVKLPILSDAVPSDPKEGEGEPSEPSPFGVAVEPAEPAEALETAETAEAVEPAEPAEPLQPVEPAEPAEPAEPLQPVEPAEPAEPLQPVEPAEPAEPIEPAASSDAFDGMEQAAFWDAQAQPWAFGDRAWSLQVQSPSEPAVHPSPDSLLDDSPVNEGGFDTVNDGLYGPDFAVGDDSGESHPPMEPSYPASGEDFPYGVYREDRDGVQGGYDVDEQQSADRAAYYGYGSRSTDNTRYLQTSQIPRQSRRSSIVVGVLVVLVVVLAGVLVFEWDDLQYVLPESSEEAQTDAQLQDELQMEYAYSTLNADDQEKYRTMLRAIKERTKLAYPVYDLEDATRIEAYVKADHPELEDIAQFCLWEGGFFTPAYIGGFYYVNEAQQALLESQVNAMAEQCLQTVPEGADDYVKAKTVYDWIANTTDYNKEAASMTGAMDIRESQDSPGTIADDSNTPRDYGQTVANVLIDHNAVCAGYARTFQMLLQKQGIQCVYVRGTVEGQSHAWCVAKLDGDYYHIDPTWGDPQYGDVDLDNQLVFPVDYNFFGVTTADITKSHVIDNLFQLPECTAVADNYYMKENLFFEQPDAQRLGELVSAVEPNSDTVLVRCADEWVFRTLLDDYVESGRLGSYIPSGAYRYGSTDDPFYLVAVMPL